MRSRDVWHKSPHKLAHEASTEGRYLHFVRHGQYQTADGSLTELGKRQARYLARELARVPIASIVSSDWIRARETARIVSDALELDLAKQHRLLREVLPTAVSGMRIPREKRAEGKTRMERIIRRFFKPARGTRHEVIVCHGNLIRALLLRISTGRVVPGWDRFSVHHAGITTFLVTRRGVIIVAYDRVAHLPQRYRTRT
jgi:serine/threonine-protein phosphatase PGAM5